MKRIYKKYLLDTNNIINKNKLFLAIIISSIILGGFFYIIQINKQKSIERQQMAKLEEDKRIEDAKMEQIKKEYTAKRKKECYDLYLQEKKQWINVKDFDYSKVRDVCIVIYKSSKPGKSKEECNKMIENLSEIKDESLRDMIIREHFNCLENTFSKEF